MASHPPVRISAQYLTLIWSCLPFIQGGVGNGDRNASGLVNLSLWDTTELRPKQAVKALLNDREARRIDRVGGKRCHMMIVWQAAEQR